MSVEKMYIVKHVVVNDPEEKFGDEKFTNQYLEKFNQLGLTKMGEEMKLFGISPVLTSMEAVKEWLKSYNSQGADPDEFIDIEIYETGQEVKVIRSSRYY
jgi:hypothetical protein